MKVRTILPVRDLIQVTVLRELVGPAPSSPVSIRDLLAVRPLLSANALRQLVGEASDPMTIRDLIALDANLKNLVEAGSTKFDAREVLERLRRLLDLEDGSGGQRFHIRLGELYYRRGRATVWDPLQEEHAQRKRLEGRYRAVKQALSDAHAGARLWAGERAGSAGRPSEKAIETRLQQAGDLHASVREAKREWVIAHNALGALREPKTRIEGHLESMRLRLLALLRDPARYLGDGRAVARWDARLANINLELERDDALYARIQLYQRHLAERELVLDQNLARAEHLLRRWAASDQNALVLALRLSSGKSGPGLVDPRLRAKRAVTLLVRLGPKLFPKGPGRAELDILLSEPIAMLESQPRRLQTRDLYRKEPVDRQQTQRVLAYAAAGYQVDLRRVEDPHALAAIVTAWLDSLPAPLLPAELLALGDLQEQSAKQKEQKKQGHEEQEDNSPAGHLRQASEAIRRLDGRRRAHLATLLIHLDVVQSHWKDNYMTVDGLADVFAPLLFRREF